MTTTTASQLARAVARAYARPLAMPLALAVLMVAPAARADWKFVPTLDLRETYTDNVALQDADRAQGQFVTELSPGFLLKHGGPRLTVNARYQLQYFATQDHDVSGTNKVARQLQAEARAKLIDDVLYLDANAARAQQNVSPFGQVVVNNNYASANRTEVATWRLSPYLVHRFGNTAKAELRYTRDSVDAGHTGLGSTDGNTLSFMLNSGTAYRKLGWGLQLSQQEINSDVANDSSIKTANGNLRYKIAPTLDLTAVLGYDKYDYQALGGVNGGRAWNAGFAWAPSHRTSLTATLGHRYYGPSRSLKALHRSRHTSWSINYDDSVSSTRANFLLPSAIDTADLLDGLFRAAYPDPVERQKAIEAYMLATHLPTSIANNINYFSNRYALQKQLRATVAYREGRTSALFSVYRVRRDALSVRETDSDLLGSSLNTINDNTSLKGFTAQWDYRLTGRTNLSLVSDIMDNASLSTGLKARSSSVRFGVRHQLRAKMAATIDVRRIEGAVLAGRPYIENALSASLHMQL
jgi:uncharacterized protein (PEP-CTERM system associated)